MRRPDEAIATRSMTWPRCSTYVPMKSKRVADERARAAGTRPTPAMPASSSWLAASSMAPVTVESAGPPLGGLYLKPPSAGGLCEGVTTMPSASAPGCSRFHSRMACDTPGVGV